MRTVHIDGLPGLTMQGIKGSLGERGCSMFYNSGSSFAFSSNFLKALAISEDAIEDAKLKDEYVKCIPCDGVQPIINDYFFNVENNYTSLYIVKDIIYFSITSYDEEGVELHESYTTDSSLDSSYSSLVKSLKPLLGKYLELYNKSKELNYITQADSYTFEKYPVYIIKYLDTWEYLDANPSTTDIGVTAITSNISLKSWNGEYTVKKQKCSGHTFDIVNVATDEDYLASVAELHRNDVQGAGGFTFKVLDASTYLPIAEPKSANVTIFKNADVLSWRNILLFEHNSNTSTNTVYERSYIEQGGLLHPMELSSDINLAYMRINIEGYFTTRVFLTGADEYTVYAFRDILTDENLNADFEVVHEYTYFDSSEPDETAAANELIQVTKFYVNSGMNSEEKSKFRIEAEFTSGEKKKYVMSTMRDNLWKCEVEDEDYIAAYGKAYDKNLPTSEEDRAICEYQLRHGYYKNFNHKMNFDNENPGDFTIVIKDYNEGNDVKLFSSSMIVPQFLKDEYKMTIYAYYKSTSDNCSKIYLGEGLFGDTIN